MSSRQPTDMFRVEEFGFNVFWYAVFVSNGVRHRANYLTRMRGLRDLVRERRAAQAAHVKRRLTGKRDGVPFWVP